METKSKKLSARQNQHFLGIVRSAAHGMQQVQIAREHGLSESTVSRILRTAEARQQVDEMRAEALLASWTAFQELLNLAIGNLQSMLNNPMTERALRARISLKLLECALVAGTPPAPPDNPATIIEMNAGTDPLEATGGSRYKTSVNASVSDAVC